MTDNYTDATARGYTKQVEIRSGDEEFAVLIRPDTDLDSTFRAFDTDNRTWLKINGWNCIIEEA